MNTLFIHLDVSTLEWDELFYIMIAAVLLGTIVSLVYLITKRHTVHDKSFVTTLIMLPLVISMIILLISNASWAAAFSLAGVFALVRFRTVIADSRDITFILSTVAIGIACAIGQIGFGVYIVLFFSAVFFILNLFGLDKLKGSHSRLQIVIPENLDFTSVFKEIFDKYLSNCQMQKVRTTDFGSLFEVTYLIKFKPDVDQKAFIDELRVRNNNLNIILVNNYAAMLLSD